MDDDLIDFREPNPYYSLKDFLIKINFDMTDVKDEDQLGEMIHEYTHYLQSLTTVNGLSILTVYLDLIIKITVDIYVNIGNGIFDSKNTINKYKDDFHKLANRMYWERKPINMRIKRNKPCYIEKLIFNPIAKTQANEIFFYNMQDELFYHVSTSVLRENMAMMAYFYSHGIGQDAVMDYVNLKNISCKYWIIFNYFLFNYPQIKDVIIFTYFFCEFVLMDLMPGIFMSEVLPELDKMLKDNIYNDHEFFFQLLSDKFQNKIGFGFRTITDVISKMRMKLNVLSFHDFYLSIQKLIDLCERGIDFREHNGTIFRRILDGRWINYMSKIFLSPLIVQPEKKYSILGDERNYSDHIILLFGIANVIQLLINDENITYCPFYKEIPICKLYKGNEKIEEICISNPIKIPLFPKGGCIFYNTCLILGLLPPNEFKKYPL